MILRIGKLRMRIKQIYVQVWLMRFSAVEFLKKLKSKRSELDHCGFKTTQKHHIHLRYKIVLLPSCF